MKKTKAKLQLKASTVRMLTDAVLANLAGGVTGGLPTTTTNLKAYCSTSCEICPTNYSACCDPWNP